MSSVDVQLLVVCFADWSLEFFINFLRDLKSIHNKGTGLFSEESVFKVTCSKNIGKVLKRKLKGQRGILEIVIVA